VKKTRLTISSGGSSFGDGQSSEGEWSVFSKGSGSNFRIHQRNKKTPSEHYPNFQDNEAVVFRSQGERNEENK